MSRVMVLAVIDAGGTRLATEELDGEYTVLPVQTAVRPPLGRDVANLLGGSKPWWVASLIGQRPRPTPWTRPIFDNRGEA